MKDLYTPENDENFGAEMLQNALEEAKKQSTLDEALAVLNSAMAAFRENTEALNRIARIQKTFAADTTPFIETAQKLIVLLEGFAEGKIPTNAIKIVNNNTVALANALGKVVNDRIDETDKAFYESLEERDIAIKRQFNDMKSLKDKVWMTFYILLTLVLGLAIFTAIILTANQMLWHIGQINVIGFCLIGVVTFLISGIVFFYHKSK